MRDINYRRRHWLKVAKVVTTATLDRARLIRYSCDDPGEQRQAVEKAIERIRKGLDSLSRVEQGDPLLGALSLFPDGVEAHVHHSLVLLVAARLNGSVDTEIRTISDIVDLVSSLDPETSLAVRSSFRLASVLRPFVTVLRKTANLDQFQVVLKESALNAILAMPPDVEALVMEDE